MSNIAVSLHLVDGDATYGELRRFVEATAHIGDEENLGIEWAEGFQEILGLKDYV